VHYIYSIMGLRIGPGVVRLCRFVVMRLGVGPGVVRQCIYVVVRLGVGPRVVRCCGLLVMRSGAFVTITMGHVQFHGVLWVSPRIRLRWLVMNRLVDVVVTHVEFGRSGCCCKLRVWRLGRRCCSMVAARVKIHGEVHFCDVTQGYNSR